MLNFNLFDFIGRIKSSQEAQETQDGLKNILHANPKTKGVAEAAISKTAEGAKQAQTNLDARKKDEINALTLQKLNQDRDIIKGFLKLFKAIESNPNSFGINTKRGILEQLAEKKLIPSEEDAVQDGAVENKRQASLKKAQNALVEKLNERRGPADQENAPEKPKYLNLKEIRKLFPSDNKGKPSKEGGIVDAFDNLLGNLQAACFAFAARYKLFQQNLNREIETPYANSGEPSDYSYLDLYIDAVEFLQQASPQYHERDFLISRQEEQAYSSSKSSSEISASSSSSSKASYGSPSRKKTPISSSSSSSSSSALSAYSSMRALPSVDASLDVRIGSLLRGDQQQTYSDLKKLILYYKQNQKLMPHEEVPRVGEKPYIQEQTEARVKLSRYDYYIIYTIITENMHYGPLVTNLLGSHKALIENLDENGKIIDQGKHKKSNFQPDPWMSDFVKVVLRNRVPLNLYVIYPDLTRRLEAVFIGKRIGAMIGVQDVNAGPNQLPLALIGEKGIILCSDDNLKVEFLVDGHWVEITTDEHRNKNLRQVLREPPHTLQDRDLGFVPDMSFNEVLDHFDSYSKTWHEFEVVFGKGLQIFNKHDGTFCRITDQDRGKDDAIVEQAKRPTPSTSHHHQNNLNLENYLFTRANGTEQDPTCRDHFTAGLTSFEDLEDQYPDYDLSPLKNGEYAVFWNANRKTNSLSTKYTHSFIKLIIPEGNNLYRIINIGYYPTSTPDSMSMKGIDLGIVKVPRPETEEFQTFKRNAIITGIAIAAIAVVGIAIKTGAINFILFHVALNPAVSFTILLVATGTTVGFVIYRHYRKENQNSQAVLSQNPPPESTSETEDPDEEKGSKHPLFDAVAGGVAGISFLGNTAKGALQVDENHIFTDRDKIGLGFVLDEARFKEFCDVLADEINKSRQEMLSFNVFGINCAYELTKIFRKSIGVTFSNRIEEILLAARQKKLDNLSFFEQVSLTFSNLIGTTEDNRKNDFLKRLHVAINQDDIDTLQDIISDLLPHFENEAQMEEVFNATAAFLAEMHLNHLKKYTNIAQGSESASTKLASILNSENRAQVHPYKQFTPQQENDFYATIDENLEKYRTLVGKQTDPETLKKEMANLLKEFIVHGIKMSSPYAADFFEGDHGELDPLVQAVKKIPNERLKSMILAFCVFLLIAPYRSRTVVSEEDGNEKSISYFSESKPDRFKLPPKIFDTVRRNDEFLIQDAVLCKKMDIVRQRIQVLGSN